jgi:hypothetical protein
MGAAGELTVRLRSGSHAALDRLLQSGREIAASPIARTLLATTIIEIVWSYLTGVRFNLGPTVFQQVATPAMVALLCRLTGRFRAIGRIADTILVWTVVAIVGAPLTYLAARADFPLRDSLLRAFDLSIGFDGFAWTQWVWARPWPHFILSLAYNSIGVQVLLFCILYPLTDEMWRFREMFWLAWLGLILTCLISAFVPAEGISARYALNPDPAWREHLIQLRSGHPIFTEIGNMRGIVFFPSYHAELAVVFAYVNRRAGLMSGVLYVLNGLMLVSAISEGDHYLADAIAGTALMIGLIFLIRYSDLARETRTAR